MTQHAAHFKKLLGEAAVLTDPAALSTWGRDWTSVFEIAPAMIVLPGSTAEVSAVLRYCHQEGLAVVPSGGRTGLCGGAVASHGELVLSLARMQAIVELDTVGLSITAEAGVITQTLQEEAARHGLFFPLDLAAKGSCQIGGNIATNAGGLKLIRFGGTREQVLGLEVVLADGEVLDLNTNLRKNNTGYDLKQMFIGSEGTLGVITKATLKLVPRPADLQLACLGLADPAAVLGLFELCHKERVTISAFEFFASAAYRKVRSCFPQLKPPFAEDYPYYVLLEIEGERALLADRLQGLLSAAFEQGVIADAVVASSSAEFHELWAFRENITESLAALGQVRKNDVAVPIARIASFISELTELLAQAEAAPIEIILFGHCGDGNLHINYVAPQEIDKQSFHAQARALEKKVFALVAQYHGSISAEHGIGLMRVRDLAFSRSEREIAWMRGLKNLLDPKGILNPGKIFAETP